MERETMTIPDRDPEWLDYIRSLRCVLCGTNRKERIPHHVRRFSQTQGTSKKPKDCHAIPMCWICHASVPHTEGYGDRWPQIMEAWIPLLLRYMEHRHSVEAVLGEEGF